MQVLQLQSKEVGFVEVPCVCNLQHLMITDSFNKGAISKSMRAGTFLHQAPPVHLVHDTNPPSLLLQVPHLCHDMRTGIQS